MTEKLKTLMDRTTDVEFAAVDLTAVFADGDRTLRRRRGLTLAGGVAALALVAGGVVLANADGDRRGVDRVPVVDGPRVTEVTWVEGSVLHSPTRQIDVGKPVLGYVRTSAGFVLLTEDGELLALRDGRTSSIGRSWRASAGGGDGYRIVADQRAGVVGWVDTSGDAPAFVVHDLVTGDEQRFADHLDGAARGELPEGAFFFAIDDGTAYWSDRRGTVATDLATGDAQVIADRAHLQWIQEARNGLRVQLVESDGGGDEGMELVDATGRALISYRDLGSPGALSPSGTWVAGYDSGVVWNVGDRRTVRLVPPGGEGSGTDVVGYEWLDDDTVAVVAESEDRTASLATCTVPAGTCTAVAEVDGERIVLPGRLPG